MSLVIKEREIPAAVETLWELIAPVDSFPQWMPDVETAGLLGIQPTGIGRRQRIATRAWVGEWTQEQVLITWEVNRRIGWRTLTSRVGDREVKGIEDLQTIITLTGRENGTTVLVETSWVSVGVVGRLFSILVLGPTIRRRNKNALQALGTLTRESGNG
jgi:hypothetical protein